MKIILVLLASLHICLARDILMVTMGGTKSHKIPFLELGRGLIARGHNITFLNGFTADTSINGLQEITPSGLVEFIRNFTNYDLLGARLRNELPMPLYNMLKYPIQSCEEMFADAETQELLNRKFDLLIMDGAYCQCALGLAHKFKAPFMYINTVAFYTYSISMAGSPAPYSVTPIFSSGYRDEMSFYQRILNIFLHWFLNIMEYIANFAIQKILKRNFSDMPPLYELGKNVSFILQLGLPSLTYPRPYLPNVAEIACIHCKPPSPLPKDLEEWVSGSGDSGFIFVSMGSSVRAAAMPEKLRLLFVQAFAQLPYRVLWKWEEGSSHMQDLPSNIKLGRWLPQQDILGHRKIRAFVTHGGLLSMFETVYHGVPIVTIPVFCDHDANSAKAEVDGYAYKLLLETITVEKLVWAITQVIHDPKYRLAVKKRQYLLKDHRTTPLDTAIYWTEYVMRHNGAYHLQSPSRNYNNFKYYSVDVFAFLITIILGLIILVRKIFQSDKNGRKQIKEKIQ